jgi:hypothetical protein
MLDEDYGDVTDPESGRDVKVSVTKQPNKSFADTKVTPRATQTPLSKDHNQAKQWLSNVPNIDDYEELTAVEEIERRVNAWLAGDTSDEVGTQRGGPPASKLSAFDDAVEQPKQKPQTKKPSLDDLDAAFEDLDS